MFSDSNNLQDYTIVENVTNGGIHVGGGAILTNCVVNSNHIANHAGDYGLRLGLNDNGLALDIECINNYVSGKGIFYYVLSPTVTGNKFFYDYLSEIYEGEMINTREPTGGFVTPDIDNNAYYDKRESPARNPFYYLEEDDTAHWYTFADWKTGTGFDANSSFGTSIPGSNVVNVFENEYKDANDIRMGIIQYWNFEEMATIDVDLSNLNLVVGFRYKYRWWLDYNGDVDEFTYDGSALTITTGAHSVSTPTGWNSTIDDNYDPLYGAFIVEEIRDRFPLKAVQMPFRDKRAYGVKDE